MNILNGFEGDILMAHSPNVIELENCNGDVFISVTGIDINVGFTRRSFQGNLSVDFYEVLRTAFTDYTDNFDYSAGDTSTTLWQHLVDFDDGVNPPVTFNIRVVNGALQLGENYTVDELLNLHHYDCGVECTSVQDGIVNTGVSAGDVTFTTDVGIVYTAPNACELAALSADLNDGSGTSSFNIDIYEGNGYGGALLYSGTQSVNFPTTLSHAVSPAIAQTQGETYTIRFTRNTAAQITVFGYVAVNPNTPNYVQYYGDGLSINQYIFNAIVFNTPNPNFTQGVMFEGYPFCTSALVTNNIERTVISDGVTIEANDCAFDVRTPCEGIYFKWLNTLGGYDYWLFNQQYSESMATKSIGAIEKYYQNRQTALSLSDDIGRDTKNSIKISSNVPTRLKRHIEGILMSPEVYLYEGDQGIAGGDWIKVVVKNGNYSLGRGSDNTIVFKTEVELPRNYSQLI